MPLTIQRANPAANVAATDADFGNTGYSDYWFNSRLAQVNEAVLTASSQIILSGDGGSATSAAFSGSSYDRTAAYTTNGGGLDADPSDDPAGTLAILPNGPAQRHMETANYLFEDGHVKALKGNTVNTSAGVLNSSANNAAALAAGKATFSRD